MVFKLFVLIQVFSDAPKLLSEVRISNDGDKLYFPLSDVIGKVRGVRWLCAEDNSSGVLPTSNCSGILFLRTHKRNNIVRESTPIVVSGIKNAVAVVSKKIPGFYFNQMKCIVSKITLFYFNYFRRCDLSSI